MQPMIDSLRSQGRIWRPSISTYPRAPETATTFDYQAGRTAMMHYGASDQVATNR